MAHVSSHLKIQGKITHTKEEIAEVTILHLGKCGIWNATEMYISNSEAQYTNTSVSLQNAAAKDCKLIIIAWKSVEVWDHIPLNMLTLSPKRDENRKNP
jgi:hypothetical protein